MESLPSVQHYCKNGLFPSQGSIGKKFCSMLLVRAAKFHLDDKRLRRLSSESPLLRPAGTDFDHACLMLAESGHNDALVLKC
ncbi:hypothetical protein DXT94_15115 [Rhizobium sp. ICMP 5592]|nr:hypothetical protein [Rhizobium sp. ICMP 5592]